MLLRTSVEEQHQSISESLLLVTGTETEEYFGPLDTGKSESLKTWLRHLGVQLHGSMLYAWSSFYKFKIWSCKT